MTKMPSEAQAVTALIEQFRRLADPPADPDAAVSVRLRDFLSQYLDSKQSEGGTFTEGVAARRDCR